jgi:hypothetical protein
MTATYVCREHPDEPVSWHGRDCPGCAQDRYRRAASRAERARKRRNLCRAQSAGYSKASTQ